MHCAIFDGISDRLTVHVDSQLDDVTSRLATLTESLTDLRPAWVQLGKHLADTAQSRWPLRRRSGKLRRSLTWSGNGLGWSGIFQSKRDRLIFGTRIFYAAFSQSGTARQPARALIHVDETAIAARLSAWTIERARAAGFSEATP